VKLHNFSDNNFFFWINDELAIKVVDLRVEQELAKKYSLSKIIHWKVDETHNNVIQTLRKAAYVS